MRKSFTLVELVVVLMILGFLVTLAVTHYGPAKEHALDNEAKANLKLIQAAMRIYQMEVGAGFDSGDNAQLNQDLKLALPAGPNINWTYGVDTSGDVFATRQGRSTRTWDLSSDDELSCWGDSCPPSP